MTVLDLDSDIAPRRPTVTEIPSTRVSPTARAGDIAKDRADWAWMEYRDYVIREIEERHGPSRRDVLKESGIFKAFVARWGMEQSIAIAEFAFGHCAGMWHKAPITVTRWTIGNDPYFAAPISERTTIAA